MSKQQANFVEATFDFVERIVQLVAFGNVASAMLLVWTGLNVRTTQSKHADGYRTESAAESTNKNSKV